MLTYYNATYLQINMVNIWPSFIINNIHVIYKYIVFLLHNIIILVYVIKLIIL